EFRRVLFRSHADDHALAPAAVRALECGAHHLDVADALEAVVHAPAGHLHDHLLDRPVVVLRVDAFGRAHLLREFELGRIGVDGDDAAGPGLLRTLDHGKTNGAEAEHGHRIALLHLRGVVDRADARGHATAEQAGVLRIRLRTDLGQRDLGDDRVFAEGRAAHVVVDRLAVVGEARGAVGHHALALGGAHGHAQVGVAALAEQALAALGGVERDHVVARLHAGHALAHL